MSPIRHPDHGQKPTGPPPPVKGFMGSIPDRELRGLLETLNRLFPDRVPALEDSDRQVWFKAGQRSVVDYLIRSYTSIGGTLPHVHHLSPDTAQAGGDPPAPASR